MSDEDRLRADAMTQGFAGGPPTPYHQADYWASRMIGQRQRAHRAEEDARARIQRAWEQDVRKTISTHVTPQPGDYGGETPAFAQAIREFHVQYLEAQIAALRKFNYHQTQAAADEDIRYFQKRIAAHSAPYPPLPAEQASRDERMEYEIAVAIRNIPDKSLLFRGTTFGGNYEQFKRDDAEYESKVRRVRTEITNRYIVTPSDNPFIPFPLLKVTMPCNSRVRIHYGNALPKEAEAVAPITQALPEKRKRIWPVVAGSVIAAAAIIYGISQVRGEPSRPGSIAMSTSQAQPTP